MLVAWRLDIDVLYFPFAIYFLFAFLLYYARTEVVLNIGSIQRTEGSMFNNSMLCSVVAEHDYRYRCSNIRRISGRSIQIIIRNTHYSIHVGRYQLCYGLRSIRVKGYGIYQALRSIFRGPTLFILCTTQNFRGMDTICTMHYTVFSWVDTKGYWCILSKKYQQYTSILLYVTYWEDL